MAGWRVEGAPPAMTWLQRVATAPGEPSRFLLLAWLAAGLLLSGAGGAAQRLDPEPAAADPSGNRYAGRLLSEALQELRAGGLKIVFTTQVVRPEMRVVAEPTAGEPRRILDELLAPHGLEVRPGPGGTLAVVPRARATAEAAEASIAGVVRARSDASPVAGVTVRVLETDAEVASGADGAFTITGLAAGSFTLEVRRRGFVVERIADVAVAPGETAEVSVLLDAAPVTEEEVVVTPSRVSLLREQPLAPLSLSRADLQALPQLGADFFRALSLLPGIASNDVTAQFHVRGSRRDETQILLDGQELYETYHLKDFDNAVSILAPATLDSVDLSTGGFSVEHGDRMAGVLDMTTVTPTGPVRTRLGVSFVNAHAGNSGTFERGRGSWMAHARRGATDLVGRLLGNEDPQYWDAFGKLDYQLTPRTGARLNYLRTTDTLEFMEFVDGDEKRLSTEYTSAYLWLTQQTLVANDLFFATAVSRSRVFRDRRGVELEEDVEFDIRDRRELEVLGLRQDWNWQASDRHYLKGGFQLRRFDAEYDYDGTLAIDSPLARIRADPDRTETVFRGRFDEDHDSLYLSDRVRLGSDVTLEAGLRWDRHTQTDESHLSPRLNLAWAVGKNGVVRAAWGRFNQSQRPYELQVEDGETSFQRVERSEHRVLGYERLFERGRLADTALRVELYQREVTHPQPRYENLYEPLNTFPEVEPDRVRVAPQGGLAEGLEVFLRGRLGRRTTWWVNYAWATTEDEIDGRSVVRRFDQTHTLNLDLDRRLGRNWRLNLAWRYHTGWPTTPLGLEPETDDDGKVVFVPVLGPAFSERLGDYHRLDLRASRAWRLRAGVLEVFVDVQNVYNRKNPSGFDYEIDEEAGTLLPNAESWAGTLPSLGLSFEF